MIETQLNIFDVVVLSIMGLSCLFAFFRGFVREILSLGAWVGAAIVTLYYFPDIAHHLQPHFRNPVVAAGVGTLGIYITALIGFSLVNRVILKFLKQGNEVGVLDNLLGLAFGAFRGAFIISLGFFLITMAMPRQEYPPWISRSMTHPYAEKGALVLAKLAPDYLREVSSLQKQAEEELLREERDDAGYNQRSRRQMERMMEDAGEQ